MSFESLNRMAIALPPPSILEKIARFDVEGPEEILDMAERIAQQRREREDEELRLKYSFKRAVRSPSFWRGMASVFGAVGSLLSGKPRFIPPQETRPVQPSNDFVHVGNDLREAITRYLAVHSDIKDKIQLTPAEEAGLRRVSVVTLERSYKEAPHP